MHNSQWITFPTLSCLVLYSFCTRLLHLLIIWLTISSLSSHNLHFLKYPLSTWLNLIKVMSPILSKFFYCTGPVKCVQLNSHGCMAWWCTDFCFCIYTFSISLYKLLNYFCFTLIYTQTIVKFERGKCLFFKTCFDISCDICLLDEFSQSSKNQSN